MAGPAQLHDLPPQFDPDDGIVLREPERSEPGYWTGCPSVVADGDRWLLTWRSQTIFAASQASAAMRPG